MQRMSWLLKMFHFIVKRVPFSRDSYCRDTGQWLCGGQIAEGCMSQTQLLCSATLFLAGDTIANSFGLGFWWCGCVVAVCGGLGFLLFFFLFKWTKQHKICLSREVTDLRALSVWGEVQILDCLLGCLNNQADGLSHFKRGRALGLFT